jgi:outer membrane receptor protein involved in Fe transport
MRTGGKQRALVVLVVWAALTTLGLTQDPGSGALRGSVYDIDFGVPLSGVRVTILEAGLAVATGPDGNFLFPRLPIGTYTVSFAKESYERLLRTDVVVTPGRVAELRIELSSEVVDLEELVVIGEDLFAGGEVGLLEIRAESLVVQDAISAELISRAGAGDVAGAVKMVVGVNVADGKYAVVRGLSDRYTGTTLNGIRVPSADPRKRAVQIDMFPTGTIDSITVTKTFTPDLSGEFTGGAVDIKTKEIPEGFTASYSQSLEYNEFATGNDEFLSYEGGGVNSSGIAGEGRGLPQIATEPGGFRIPAFRRRPSAEEIAASNYFDRFTRSFSPTLGVSRGVASPNFGFGLSAGHRVAVGPEGNAGLFGAISYSHKFDYYDNALANSGIRSDAGTGIGYDSERVEAKGTDEVLWGALIAGKYELDKNHSLAMRIVGNQSAEDEARRQIEQETPTLRQINQALRYVERTLVAGQLHGDHRFERAAIDWTVAKNSTKQDEPDSRFFRYNFDTEFKIGDFPTGTTDALNTRRIFRTIRESNWQGALNFAIPFESGEQLEGRFKAGLYIDRSDRSFDQLSYTWTFPGVFGPARDPSVIENRSFRSFQQTAPGQLWTDVFAAPNRIGLAKNEPFAPNQLLWVLIGAGGDVPYSATQNVHAAYVMGEIPLAKQLKLIAGARYETTELSVTPDTLTDLIDLITSDDAGNRGISQLPEARGATSLDEKNWLPAVGIVWAPNERMNVRFNWAETIARPSFRELAPVAAIEVLAGDEFFGNPELQFSEIANYDLRWEWFATEQELLSASVFYKEITNPIELISFGVAGRPFVQPVNYPRGSAVGVELELRGGFERVWKRLAGLAGSLNLTWLETKVDYPQSEIDSLADFGLGENERRLSGQPEYLVNLSVTYDNENSGTSAGLFYNLIGETVQAGAARGLNDAIPSTYEQPYGTLDLSLSQKVRARWTFTFRAKNLLTPEREVLYRSPDGLSAIKSLRETPRLYSASFGLKW